VYGLRVKGESMIDAFIADGDLVLLEPVDRVENGDMVAAWLTDREEATLKRFYLEGNRVRLQPENSAMEPIYVPAKNVAVRGKVVGVIRSM
jgi:repressor LexA